MASLKALQAFEAAARTGSFRAAAAELSVSPAAVSQLVRALEKQIGHPLFYRANRGITPTEAGLEMLPRLSGAFEELEAVANLLNDKAPQARLSISMPPSLITGWLAPRVADFLAEYGDIDISLRAESDPVPFDHERIDIRLSYGRFFYQSLDSLELLTDAVYAVCSPAYLNKYGPYADLNALKRAKLIHTDWGHESAMYPSWRALLGADSVPADSAGNRGLMTNSSHASMTLACDGLGVALSQGLLVASYLENGDLVLATHTAVRLPRAYWLTSPATRHSRDVVSAFQNWLSDQCRACVTAACLDGCEVLSPADYY